MQIARATFPALRRVLSATVVCLLPLVSAQAQNVALAGMFGSTPLLVIDGSAPKAVAVGATHLGIKVLAAGNGQATLSSGGKPFTVRLGEAPINATATASAGDTKGEQRIVLNESGGGHFTGNGSINGKTMHFVVDTGATMVSIGLSDAERMGLNYKQGQRVGTQTANGTSSGWLIKLDSVTVGSVKIHNVDAIVNQANMPVVLLGNSFLSRFSMTRSGSQMILTRTY